jgi:DNA-binding Lrp family transcriptional regulator
MIDKVDQIKKAREEVTLVPKKHRVSDIQSPSAFFVGPSRALNDNRILANPSSLQVLCVLCSYVQGTSGIAFPSQILLAKRLGRTQQAISRQIVKLIEWGYIKKIINENPLRQKGKKTATYRLIYDPKISDRQLINETDDPIIESKKAQETLKKIQPEVVKKKKVYNTIALCRDTTSEVVQNYSSLTNNNYIKEKIKEYLNVYTHALDLITQTRGQWRWDQREEAIVEEIINLGVTLHEFRKAVQKKLHQCRKDYSRPPYTIAYFKAYWQPKPKTTEGITKELGKKMKPKYTHMYKS